MTLGLNSTSLCSCFVLLASLCGHSVSFKWALWISARIIRVRSSLWAPGPVSVLVFSNPSKVSGMKRDYVCGRHRNEHRGHYKYKVMVQKNCVFSLSLLWKTSHLELWPSPFMTLRGPEGSRLRMSRSRQQQLSSICHVFFFFSHPFCVSTATTFDEWVEQLVHLYPLHIMQSNRAVKAHGSYRRQFVTELAPSTLDERLITLIWIYFVKWAQCVIGFSTEEHVWTEWIRLCGKVTCICCYKSWQMLFVFQVASWRPRFLRAVIDYVVGSW